MKQRPLLFKWRHFEPQIIVCAVVGTCGTACHIAMWGNSWRNEELRSIPLASAEFSVMRQSSICGCVHIWKPTNVSWRVDETHVGVKGRWCYLYRAIDSCGATIEFLLSAFRDLEAVKSLFRRALRDGAHRQPRVINTDLAPTYASAIPGPQRTGVLRRRCRHRPVQYLNNIIEQDHRAIKKRINAKQGFCAFGALGTFVGI